MSALRLLRNSLLGKGQLIRVYGTVVTNDQHQSTVVVSHLNSINAYSQCKMIVEAAIGADHMD